MVEEKKVFIDHVISTVENQLENNDGVMISAEFNPKVFEGIRMYLEEIIIEGRSKRLDIEEDSIENTLLVIKI